jgi:hypothetical protein
MFTRRLNPATALATDSADAVAPEATATPRSAALSAKEQAWWLVFIALHAPLGLWMQSQSMVVWAQGAFSILLGCWWSLNSSRMDRVAYVAAYMVGSEVLWRMVTDALPWESAKYGLVMIFSAALLNRFGLKSLLAPALCFSLLLPSVAVTVDEAAPAALRGMLSFNLSGPLSLAVSAAFFSRLQLSPAMVLRVFLLLVAPVVAIGSIVVFNIVTAEHLTFTFESNFATSGGFGPNQVSLALGLGALSCFWCLLARDLRWPARTLLFPLMLWLAAQCALTFSRGGMLGASLSAAIALVFLVLDADARRKLVLVVPLLVVIGYFVIWPALVNFTGGNLAVRYGETGLTHRDELGSEDLDLWMRNPVLGVGPGMSPRHHLNGVAAHTEFTRLLAEHGFFGAVTLGLLVGLGVRNIYRAPTPHAKALVASAFAWSLLFMVNSAMRTVAPSFMYGLSCCVFAYGTTATARRAEPAEEQPTRRLVGGRSESSAA